MKVFSLGIIGYGAIGRFIARYIRRGELKGYQVRGIFDIDRTKLHQARDDGFEVFENFEQFLKNSYDIVVESASQEAVRQYLIPLIKQGITVLVMSGGAFADLQFKEQVERILEAMEDVRVIVPSGAISGLDGLEAMLFAGEIEVILETRKSPISLGFTELKEEKVIFEGDAIEAAKRFPRNINVAMALALAVEKPERVKVRIIADPKVKRNIHFIRAKGNSGHIEIKVENLPFPENPKTSFLAALSALQILKKFRKPFIIGG